MQPNYKLALYAERIAIGLCVLAVLNLCSTFFIPPVHLPVEAVIFQMLAMVTLCIVHAAGTKGWKRALTFSAISFAISWFVEFIGCNYGWWFGDYEYTDKLGWSIGNVPLVVVFSWEVVIYPSLLLADELMGRSRSPVYSPKWFAHVVVASLATAVITTAWDLMTDPISVREVWWKWDFGGGYLPEIDGGVPFSNFVGWIEAVFLISLLYRLVYARDNANPESTEPSPFLFAASLYTALMLSGVVTLLYFGFHLPIMIGLFGMGPVVLLAWGKYIARR